MQGGLTESEICAAIDNAKNMKKCDTICIIRGGGSKVDLAAFDNFNIGYKIGTCSIPVFTGIGHEIDQSIADITAHTALKTPTAVADHIINHNANFESKIVNMQQTIERLANVHVKNARLRMESYNLFFKTKPKEILKQRNNQIDQWTTLLKNYKDLHLKNNYLQLKNIDSLLQLSDPKNIMKRGFVLVKNGSKYITSSKEMKNHKDAKIEFHDGSISVNVQE
jgi:exodeoxyribonuclease VII large subunit